MLEVVRGRADSAWNFALDRLCAIIVIGLSFVRRSKDFVVAGLATTIYYFPSMPHKSREAGYLYTGDVLGYYWPAVIKVKHLLSRMNFTAIDVSQFNGSADFFLAPNFFAVHPGFVLYSLLSGGPATAQGLARALVIILALHSFAACYFTIRLLTRFFSFEFGLATFVGVFYAFSVHMVQAHGEPQFVFCASLVPWCVYAGLAYEEDRRASVLVLGSLPILVVILGGYIPVGIACLFLATALVIVQKHLVGEQPTADPEIIRRTLISLAPFALGALVASPFLLATLKFLQQSPNAGPATLFYSAHQLGELPQAILRLLSFNFVVPGAFYEFSTHWGLIAVTIVTIFLLSPEAQTRLSPREWALCKVSATIYFVTVLSTFGVFSAVSNLVFYFVPQVGQMHIYQRFLLPAHLLLGIMLALMLGALTKIDWPRGYGRAALLLLTAMMSAAFVVARHSTIAEAVGLNNAIVVELFLASLFVMAFMVPGAVFRVLAATVLMALPSLNTLYSYSRGDKSIVEKAQWQQPVFLSRDVQEGIVAFLKRNSKKTLVKYADLTPLWTKDGVETFPKVFPYLVLNDIALSSYGGFTFYLSTRRDYMERMPVGGEVELNPDWQWLADTGIDFVVMRKSDLDRPALKSIVGDLGHLEIHSLPNDVIIVPVSGSIAKTAPRGGDAPAFDNGYFRVAWAASSAGQSVASENIARGKAARQSSTTGAASADRAVDGNTDGNFAGGSVSHTGPDLNAWLEIDLGKSESIGSVKVWNRTDCCSSRLRNFWVFVSDAPFADTDTAEILRGRAGVWNRLAFSANPSRTVETGGVSGRYVRIQLDGNGPVGNSFLHVAELEVYRATSQPSADGGKSSSGIFKAKTFETNNANYFKLEFEASAPVDLAYLMWNNPRLEYFVNGARVHPADFEDIATLRVPSGTTTIVVRYRNWGLAFFWLIYGLFGMATAWAIGVEILRLGNRWKVVDSGGATP